MEITSLDTVFPPRTLFRIRSSTSFLNSARSDSLVRSNSLDESRNCATWYGPSDSVTFTGALKYLI